MIRVVLIDFGETLVEEVSDEVLPLARQELMIFDDVQPALERLQQAGYHLAIVSNTSQTGDQGLSHVLERLGIRDYFSTVVTSFEIGRDKPDPAPFLAALNRLNCQPQEAAMVGNDLAKDIQGAAELGMTTFWLARNTVSASVPITPDFTVSSLLELFPILSSIAKHKDG